MAVITLIAMLHCMMGVARDHCNFVLKCLRVILQLAVQAQNLRAQQSSAFLNSIPITLPTALQYLGLQDHLNIYTVCRTCHALYNQDSNTPDTCTSVNIDGHLCGRDLFKKRHRGNRTWRKPARSFSHQPLESWLSRFLNWPGIEDLLESTCPVRQTTCTDVWGADLLSEFPGNGEPSFFDSPPDELRLAFLVYHDFYNPLSNKQSGKKRSVGLVLMVCLNLPPDIRYDLQNVYVTGMIPGPKEPALEAINHFIRPIATDLKEHYSPGIYIAKTHKYPRGRKVRSAVPITSMDIPASRAWGGIGSQSHTIFCSFCNATLPAIDNFDLSAFHTRSMHEHAVHVQRWQAARNSKDQEIVWKDHGARYSEWLAFPWWNVFTGTTIAPMHWSKNVLEKQIRENMGCSATVPAGAPRAPALSRSISTLELEWGELAMLYHDSSDLEKTKLPEPLLRYLCRQRGIFEAGLASSRLVQDLNHWVSQRPKLPPKQCVC